jgi:hypothetical protein
MDLIIIDYRDYSQILPHEDVIMELVRNKHLFSIYHMKHGNVGGENRCFRTTNNRIDDALRSYLIKHGFMEDYQCWNKHGEEGLNDAVMRDSSLEREAISVSKKSTTMM